MLTAVQQASFKTAQAWLQVLGIYCRLHFSGFEDLIYSSQSAKLPCRPQEAVSGARTRLRLSCTCQCLIWRWRTSHVLVASCLSQVTDIVAGSPVQHACSYTRQDLPCFVPVLHLHCELL